MKKVVSKTAAKKAAHSAEREDGSAMAQSTMRGETLRTEFVTDGRTTSLKTSAEDKAVLLFRNFIVVDCVQLVVFFCTFSSSTFFLKITCVLE